jgi:phospholipase D1/2
MLVWDDKSNNYPLPIAGVMGTHDNETHNYFKGTKVVCLLCPRQGGTEDSYLQVG